MICKECLLRTICKIPDTESTLSELGIEAQLTVTQCVIKDTLHSGLDNRSEYNTTPKDTPITTTNIPHTQNNNSEFNVEDLTHG